jgi:glutathione S-transferase
MVASDYSPKICTFKYAAPSPTIVAACCGCATVKTQRHNSGMITLHKYISAWGLPDISPFCSKLEIYLRMAGWQYQTKLGDSRKAPKGKLPFIEIDSHTLCDSSDIIDALEARADHPLGAPLDAGLPASDKAVGRAMQSMLEEHFYFVSAWNRWAKDEGWAHYQPVLKDFVKQAGVPAVVAGFVTGLIRRDVIKSIRNQGVGRHTDAQINAIGIKLLSAVADWLADKPFMLGDQPRTLDATAYAFLNGVLDAPIENAIKAHLQSRANLVSYCARMKARYWTQK